jgi:hypothetical protein
MIPIRLLRREDQAALAELASDVFDKPIDPRLLADG